MKSVLHLNGRNNDAKILEHGKKVNPPLSKGVVILDEVKLLPSCTGIARVTKLLDMQ